MICFAFPLGHNHSKPVGAPGPPHYGQLPSPSLDTTSHPSRQRRSISRDRYVEVLVVADKKMAEYHGNNLEHYLLTLMAVVSKI